MLDPMVILQAQPKSTRDESQAKKKDNCGNYNKGPAEGWAFIYHITKDTNEKT